MYLVLGEQIYWNPCPDNWHYVTQFGSCYFQLSKWNEWWLQAKQECQKIDPGSTLVYIDEINEDKLIFQLFWRYDSTWSWIGASISSGNLLEHFAPSRLGTLEMETIFIEE